MAFFVLRSLFLFFFGESRACSGYSFLRCRCRRRCRSPLYHFLIIWIVRRARMWPGHGQPILSSCEAVIKVFVIFILIIIYNTFKWKRRNVSKRCGPCVSGGPGRSWTMRNDELEEARSRFYSHFDF